MDNETYFIKNISLSQDVSSSCYAVTSEYGNIIAVLDNLEMAQLYCRQIDIDYYLVV